MTGRGRVSRASKPLKTKAAKSDFETPIPPLGRSIRAQIEAQKDQPNPITFTTPDGHKGRVWLDNVRVLLANVYRHPITKGWRMTLKVENRNATQPTELRAYLRRGSDVVSETWTYALPPR